MRAFCSFLNSLSASRDPEHLVRCLQRLFAEAAPEDLPHFIALLSGHPPARGFTTRQLSGLVAETADFPDWLLKRCREEVSDLPEYLARCWPREGSGLGQSLHHLITHTLPGSKETADLSALWDQCTTPERILVNRLLLARFPKALPRPLIAQALAPVLDTDPAGLEIQLAATPKPTAQQLSEWSHMHDSGQHQPYPWPEPRPLRDPGSELDPLSAWQVEWVWSGVPAQLMVRENRIQLWTEAGLVSDRFPSIVDEAADLLEGTVLEGQLMNPPGDPPLRAEKLNTCDPDPVLFMARDCLEIQGIDIRTMPLYSRREQLLPMVGDLDHPHFRASEPLFPDHPQELQDLQTRCRDLGARGLLFKPLHGDYNQEYRIWRVPRLQQTLHLLYVLTAGEPEYTFGIKQGEEWIPLTRLKLEPDQQDLADKLNACVQARTVEKKGPVRLLEPGLQALISYDDEIPSPRHKSGVEWLRPRVEMIL
ncbi:MAG: hypothetical protein WD708_09620 [Kiritimatiellia bacterium]